MIDFLKKQGQKFSVLFYNPNIAPVEEYQKRCQENKHLCESYNVPFISLEYDHDAWRTCVKGLENEPERGKRCWVCFEMRLQRAHEFARQNGFDAVTSVLGVSRYKDLKQVNTVGEKVFHSTNIPYIGFNWRKGGLQEIRSSLIQEFHLYNQNFCGCPYSLKKNNYFSKTFTPGKFLPSIHSRKAPPAAET